MNLCFAAATAVFNSLDSLVCDLTATLEPANGEVGADSALGIFERIENLESDIHEKY